MTEKFQPKKAFVLYQDFFPTLMKLSVANRGHLITAIYEYHGTGKVSFPMKGSLAIAFETLRATLDRDAARYAERCERNRQNGAKGGRPRKDSSNEKAEKPRKADIDINIDKDIDKNIDIDIDMDIEIDIERESQSDELSPKEAPPAVPDGKDQEELYRLGIPLGYAKERWNRAEEYGREKRMKTTDVLFEWWKKDRENRKSLSLPKRGISSEHKSYDIDAFAEAAIARSWATMMDEE